MQYHSLSLSENGFSVKLVGFSGSIPHHQVIDAKNIEMYFVREVTSGKGLPKVVCYAVKVILQSFYLIWTMLFRVGATEFIILQNPPCIPGLAICWLLSLFNGSKLIIDWHNYGYSILSLTLGKLHILVKLAKWYEEMFGQLSSANLCVTKAMEQDLMQKWNISAEVMHDRPASIFKILSMKEKHELFLKLSSAYPVFKCEEALVNSTRFTCSHNNEVTYRKDRPALVVSSTSWTEDEDFSILLAALEEYEALVERGVLSLPHIICAITGKGPMKAFYQEQVASRQWTHVQIIMPWLESEDYPKLLACADLGVSLHTSSSGLDLPMKVVDMFGCGLPVAAMEFSCLNELVQHQVNGLVFKNATELNQQMQLVFTDFPQNQSLLLNLRKNVEHFRKTTWNDSWNKIVLPLFKESH
ncbi:unnamed protein product [Clavelina lepadiformis]|uniref:Chitobiosyldiphosphodolichol beta-mannosyltransferase n=1 Tax=Clavelina lepadiformis TaxID=159417 RepID=A0ABP0FV40_CLALP